ncbi:rhomboid family intramembrane serine protease [Bacteroidia bacterium]|nr:rhomboid family intramembrane serine protease [Bacteroidia bacterium]
MNPYFRTPPLVINLIIINVLVFMAQVFLPSAAGQWLENLFALHFWQSSLFRPWQAVSYMFMHGSWEHLFFNMFALWMFGRILEYDLGGRRFLIFYFVCGIGAALMQLGVNWIEVGMLNRQIALQPALMSKLLYMIDVPTVGASGAIFGVLLAFGMLHPNDRIMLLFPPIPMKAKYFVIGYGVLELAIGLANPGDSVAHFAHIGGMLWGLLLLLYWRRQNRRTAGPRF